MAEVMSIQVGVQRHEDTCGTATTLQRGMAAEGCLQHREPVGRRCESLDGADVATLRLDCKHQAGTGRQAVDDDCAGSAYAMLATHVRAGRAHGMTQCIAEQYSGLDFHGSRLAVEGEANLMAAIGVQLRHAAASNNTFRPSWRTSSRR